MKKYYWVILLQLFVVGGYAQVSKPAIDDESYKKFWEYSIGDPKISNNGKYLVYNYNTPVTGGILVIKSFDGKFKKEFKDSGEAVFTDDSNRIVFNHPDGIILFDLETKQQQLIKDGRRFSIPKKGNERWLAYHLKGNIILKDFLSGKDKMYPGATEARFNEQGTVLVLQTNTSVRLVSLPDGHEKIIQNGAAANNVSFDNTGKKLVFTTNDSSGNTIWYYQPDMDTARIHISSHSKGIQSGLTIAAGAPYFSHDGAHIFFKLALSKQTKSTPSDSSVITDKVNIWHYKDEKLPPWQLKELSSLKYRTFTAVTSINETKVIQLENPDTTLVVSGIQKGKYVLVSNFVDIGEAFWNKSLIKTYHLISILDGSTKTILSDAPLFTMALELSPEGKFVTWFDPVLQHYRSYEIATSIMRNITQPIKVPLNDDETFHLSLKGFTFGSTWLAGDSTLLIYDRYDIWMVDPWAKKKPENITLGYGRQHNIRFRIAADESNLSSFRVTDTLLLAAFNRDNKYNGIWRKPPGVTSPLILGNMDPCLYYFPGISLANQPPLPVKAKNAGVYLVQRMSAALAPNLFATTDFKSFTEISDIQPQKEYNWMTTELHHWKMPNGKTTQGILYKPEDFDPRKKYPIIFTYYEKRSDELYVFKRPGLSEGTLNIPWYVSNGYLVFEPDMYYTIGHTGQSVVNVVESAVKHLSKLSYIDTRKMGLQGHSFGGYETNYLMSNTNLFAAAQASAGMTDFISHYGAIGVGGKSLAFLYETGQSNLRTTPWQRPDLYIENSPLFKVDKITTPLLMQYNKEDSIVPFEQGMELFTALRRLQKPVWMVEYDGEGHIISDEKNQLDFTIRQQQFFDHYLKGKPAPVWMLEGMKAKDKGLKSGLSLDLTGKRP